AAEDVNRGGGILGRTVVLEAVREEDFTDTMELESVVSRSLQTAAKIGSDDSVVAVVGHGASSTAIPASALYDLKHKPFLATHATATSLTNHGFDYVFALQPSNYANTSMMAHYALQQGLRRFIV